MKALAVVVIVFAVATGAAAQERDTPKDSTRVSISGCARGRTFIASARMEGEPVRSSIEPGRRFRLSGQKKLLEEIKGHERTMIEVTGLVRASQLAGPGGVSVLGGRVRIGGALPRDGMSDPKRDPGYNEVVLDLESWRPLSEACAAR